VGWQTLLLIGGVVVLGWIVAMVLFSVLSRPPANLGVVDGKLAPCPSSPNCVCTFATDHGHRIEPIRFDGSAAEARARLDKVLASWPRVRVVSSQDNYIHAEFTSLVFRFVDDVELLIDEPAHVIHFRSASRAGQSDFGVNRRRMEALRKVFGEQAGQAK
jgi:uncharacterized protein (DUF1499 family)